jgi:hypothetical protein
MVRNEISRLGKPATSLAATCTARINHHVSGIRNSTFPEDHEFSYICNCVILEVRAASLNIRSTSFVLYRFNILLGVFH